MKNAKEMALYRELLLDYKPINKFSNKEDLFNDVITNLLLNIYDEIKSNSENLNCIANGCSFAPLVTENIIETSELRVPLVDIEDAILADNRFDMIEKFYSDLGYVVKIVKVWSGRRYILIHINTREYIDWVESNNIDLSSLIF